MNKILIINGHPDAEPFCMALAGAYIRSALDKNAEVRAIDIRDLHFNPNLKIGYEKGSESEPDLFAAWEKVKWAEHLVWVHPVCQGGLPALTKGFIDRVFLPGFALRYRENSVWWNKLLKEKTAHILTAFHQPGLYYWLVFRRPCLNQLKQTTLQYCGIRPFGFTQAGTVSSRLRYKKQNLS